MKNTVAKWIKEDKEKWFTGYSCIMLNVLGELQEYDYLEYDDLDMEKYSKIYDVFCTQNTFKSKKRTKDNVLQLRVLWQDIDNVKDIPLTIKRINKLVEEGEIPAYHQIVDSGTGLHIKWILRDYSGSKRNIKAWEKLQKDFYKKLKPLGADKGALDVARVLRVVGSINSKNNHVVKMIVDKPILPYDLWELYNKYIYVPYKKDEKPKKNTKKNKANNIRLFTSNYNLNKTRLADFEKLLEIRHNKMDSIRNKFMMLYGTYYILSGASSEATEEKLKELNRKIRSKKRASNSEIKTIVRNGIKRAKASVENSKVLPKNETIIEMLDITIEEQKALKTIISKEVKANRRNEHKRENRRNENGLTSREQKKQDLIKRVSELKDNGYKQVEIAEKLNISKGRVSQILNKELKGSLNKNNIDDMSVDILVKTKEEITSELPEKKQVKITEQIQIDTLNKYKNYKLTEIEILEKFTKDKLLKKFNEMAP